MIASYLLDAGEYPSGAQFMLEFTHNAQIGNSHCVRLFDVTADAPVSG